jgi:GxxExxY protein
VSTIIRAAYFPLEYETSKIIAAGIEIHKNLGGGFKEIVYKDAFEYEFNKREISFEREKVYEVKYKEIILPHHFCADFVVFDKVVLEVKAKDGIADEDYAQTINYLKCSDCPVGLIINFGKKKADIRRVLLGK